MYIHTHHRTKCETKKYRVLLVTEPGIVKCGLFILCSNFLQRVILHEVSSVLGTHVNLYTYSFHILAALNCLQKHDCYSSVDTSASSIDIDILQWSMHWVEDQLSEAILQE